MKFKTISAKETAIQNRATVHQSGKLGFTTDAADTLQLTIDKGILLMVDEEGDGNDLYMQVVSKDNEDAYTVNKAGDYFFASTRSFFEFMEIDYRSRSISYHIREVDTDESGNKIYRLKRKESEKRRSQKKGEKKEELEEV